MAMVIRRSYYPTRAQACVYAWEVRSSVRVGAGVPCLYRPADPSPCPFRSWSMIRRSVPALLCPLAPRSVPVCSCPFLSLGVICSAGVPFLRPCPCMRSHACVCVSVQVCAHVFRCRRMQAGVCRYARVCRHMCGCMRAGVCRRKRPCACAYACVCAGVCACVRGVAAVSGRFFSGSDPDPVLKPPRQKIFFAPEALILLAFLLRRKIFLKFGLDKFLPAVLR